MASSRMPRGARSVLATAVAEVARIEAPAKVWTTSCDDGLMRWRVWGGGQSLVLLHGDFGSWTHWLRNVLPLAANFQVIVPDMPGYGDSDTLPEPWSPESLAGILAEGLAEIVPPPQRYNLAGFSFGGIIAGHLAAREGERVGSLVLLGAGGFALPWSGRPPELLRIGGDMSVVEMLAVHRHNLAALMIADPGKVDDLAVYLQIENTRRARVRAGGIPASDSLLRALPYVRARIHGIWGGRDTMTFPYVPYVEGCKAVLRRFQPDLDFRIIDDAGHWTPYEASDAVNGALLDMLGKTTVLSTSQREDGGTSTSETGRSLMTPDDSSCQ